MEFKERYIFDSKKDLIGKGGFSKVFRAFDTIRKRQVALKFYQGIESEKYDIISEINRMDDIVHPNLIRYYDADIIESVNAIGEREQIQVGIMEYADAGDIGIFFKKQHSPETTRDIVLDIIKGIQFLHMQGIAHRDLKPKNILLSQSKTQGRLVAKIADFGISKRIGLDDASVSSQLLGSVEYMAPEQFAPAVYGINGKLDTNADLWSLGIILYEIFASGLPFGSRTKGITYEQILNNILFQDLDIDYSLVKEPYRSVVKRCLIKHAGQRAQQAEELIDILIEGKSDRTPKPQTNDEATTVKMPKSQGTKTKILGGDKGKVKQDNADNDKTKVIGTKVKDEKKKAPKKDNKKLAETFAPEVVEEKRVQKIRGGRVVANEIKVGKNLFKLGNYPESFKILDKYPQYEEFDTEATFYLGYMYYNGKCGGAHDVGLGRKLMNEAKSENRPLVLELMLKYVLNK